jgi:hypothetical protein
MRLRFTLTTHPYYLSVPLSPILAEHMHAAFETHTHTHEMVKIFAHIFLRNKLFFLEIHVAANDNSQTVCIVLQRRLVYFHSLIENNRIAGARGLSARHFSKLVCFASAFRQRCKKSSCWHVGKVKVLAKSYGVVALADASDSRGKTSMYSSSFWRIAKNLEARCLM